MKLRLLLRISFILLYTSLTNLNSQTPGTLKWAFSLNSDPAYYLFSSPAIGSDGTIYIGSTDKNLYAVNPNGTKKWVFPLDYACFESTPTISSNGTIYIALYSGTLYAINSDGTQKWTYKLNSGFFIDLTVGSDGTIYICGNYELYAIRPDGTLKWIFNRVRVNYDWKPVIDFDGTIYIYGTEGLYAIRPDGTQKWVFTFNLQINSPMAIGFDGTIYFSAGTIDDHKLFAINPDGTQKWTYKLGVSSTSLRESLAIDSDGIIYVSSTDSKLFYAIRSDGTQKWIFSGGGDLGKSPAIGLDGTIYLGCWDGNLLAINPNGTQKWTFTTGGSVFSSPAIGSDGTIYFASGDKKLYAINSGCGGLANSAWPKYGGNNKNTGLFGGLYLYNQPAFKFITAGQYSTQSFSIFNSTENNIVITGCTFDNSAFSLVTSLPLTVEKGATTQLSVRISNPSSNKYLKSKLTVTYTINSQTKTDSYDISEGLFVDENSELSNSAHQAIDAYNNCYVKYPNSLATTHNIGVLFRLLGEYVLAEQYLTESLSSALNMKYGYTGIKLNLGVVKSDKGISSDAVKYYSDSESDITASSSESSLAPKIYYNQAWELYLSNSLTQAFTKINSTISHSKTNDYLKAKSYVLRGAIYNKNNDITNAKKDMTTAKSLDPNGPIGRMADENLIMLNLITYTLTVTSLNGTVTKNPDQANYNDGSTVQLTATPNIGYTFTGWSGDATGSSNPLTVTMNSNKNIIANFTKNRYTVTLTANPINGGTVSGSGTFDHGSSVTITATPKNITGSKFQFINWTENGSEISKNSSYTFSITSNRNFIGNFLDITSVKYEGGIPTEFILSQNYPNPFNPTTNIQFSIPKEVMVRLSIYNTLGQEIAILVNQELPAGRYSTEFDAAEIPNGVYFYKIQAGEFNQSKKMIFVK